MAKSDEIDSWHQLGKQSQISQDEQLPCLTNERNSLVTRQYVAVICLKAMTTRLTGRKVRV